ncbi:hypothetical protein VDGE_30793 [Verticillium dahliae]|uniref:Uncharacterized protein n=1 Tax=Verticillium dahliae TaxID=27337 RepID=A0A444RJZ2_VERDA|nr:hypothetical protein VDGE_30793 [Verticillium dahliae]
MMDSDVDPCAPKQTNPSAQEQDFLIRRLCYCKIHLPVRRAEDTTSARLAGYATTPPDCQRLKSMVTDGDVGKVTKARRLLFYIWEMSQYGQGRK